MFDDLHLRRGCDLVNGHSDNVFNETSQIVRVADFRIAVLMSQEKSALSSLLGQVGAFHSIL
jgi:hypothetical protein